MTQMFDVFFNSARLALPPLTRRFSSTPNCGSFLRFTAQMTEAPTSTAPVKRLFAADSPLVWVDCEMTGLAPGKDKLLEIAVRTALLYTFSSLTVSGHCHGWRPSMRG